MNLSERVERLEANVRWTRFWLGLALVGYLFIPPAHTIELQSPDGQSLVRIVAGNEKSGVWVTRGEGKPHVSMWNYLGGGVGVGVYGANSLNNMDAAIAASPNGGLLQLTDPENRIKIYSADSLIK